MLDNGCVTDSLNERIAELSAAGFAAEVVSGFRDFITGADEEQLFRTNPLRYARQAAVPEPIAVELFVHAARVGIFDFDWGLVCPRCGLFYGTPARLQVLTHAQCGLCQISIAPSVDDNVEISFTVAPGVRRLRFHKPLAELDEHDATFASFTPSLTLAPGFSDAVIQMLAARCKVEPSKVAYVDAEIDPTLDYVLGAPLHHAATRFAIAPEGTSEISIDLLERGMVPANVTVAPGPLRIRVQNRTPRTAYVGLRALPVEVAAAINRGDMGLPVERLPYLSAQRLLASQAFRDLFPAESLPMHSGLQVRNLTVLFTDLKGSTALYDRVGDVRAYALVREHFALLRQLVVAYGGAVVKTMGDAIMASFSEPRGAMEAAIAMRGGQRMPEPDLPIKIGLHSGGCIAVENNERLDYFGQTVNIAARVQGLAQAHEIVCTDTVFDTPGVDALAERAQLVVHREQAALRGVEGRTAVVRLQQPL